jgi:hypothetical protein
MDSSTRDFFAAPQKWPERLQHGAKCHPMNVTFQASPVLFLPESSSTVSLRRLVLPWMCDRSAMNFEPLPVLSTQAFCAFPRQLLSVYFLARGVALKTVKGKGAIKL